ncbi:Chymotrypsin BI [Frankliniella fusca]|uniref:Chymotrypsin BI n=1 Tax=Frankliniella fusca TaxID=407009 RepID=A0AAE1HCN7_9NEOP|nr:Chymotrypsin BI [Frankliniella fusca]
MPAMKSVPAVLCAAVLACAVVSQENEVESAGLKIFNGDVATRTQFPYQAAIYIDLSVFCGGSLINEKWVLTAAHCVDGGNVWYVLLGVTESLTPKQDGRRTYITRGGVRHPDYNSKFIINDIGLIQLMRPATLSEYIQTIPLTPKNKNYIGTLPTVSGFGRTDDTNASPVSPVLHYTSLPVVKNEVCSDAYGSKTGDDPSVICLRAEGTSSCKGDSGGPLVLQGDDGKVFQIGTVSFGAKAGCTVGMPVGYGNLAMFIDWISSTTGVDFSS